MLIECNDDHAADGVRRLTAWLEAHDYEVLFFDHTRLRPVAEYDRAEHWVKHTIENFICLPRGDAARRRRLDDQVAKVVGR